jgi:hypothetical protein
LQLAEGDILCKVLLMCRRYEGGGKKEGSAP